MLGRQKLSALG